MQHINPSAARDPRGARRRRRRGPNAAAPSSTSTQRAGQPASRVAVDATPATPIDPDATFASLGVPAPITAELAAQGIERPFPIQTATLGDSLAGRDVLGRGKTGSGKTIAFAIPVVARLAAQRRRPQAGHPRALVLVPTRELANQVAETIAPLAAALRLRHTVIFGGVGQMPQVTALRQGVDIVIACPGRLEDLIGQGHCRLDQVEITVLDEADHMADLGFLPVVRRLLDATPAGIQRLLFSATLDNGIDVLVQRYLSDPVVRSVDPAVSPVAAMEHHVFAVSSANKAAVVRELAQGQDRSLLFTRTKYGAKKLAKQLTASGIPAVEMHGNLSQGQRERNLESFSEGSTRVLVATDIAARGIHVDDVNLVVHVDPPAEHKAYLHRSGRTARAGAAGVVVTLMTPEQAGDVRDLTRKAQIDPIVTSVEPGHTAISSLVGPAAARVEPSRLPLPATPARDSRPAARSGARARGPRPGQARSSDARRDGERSGSGGGHSVGSGASRNGGRAGNGGRGSNGGGAGNVGNGDRSRNRQRSHGRQQQH